MIPRSLRLFRGSRFLVCSILSLTPPQVVAKLRQALSQVNKDPEFIALVEKDGGRVLNIPSSEQQGFLNDEINRWVPLVAKSNVKID